MSVADDVVALIERGEPVRFALESATFVEICNQDKK
jgi:hypothetical protein